MLPSNQSARKVERDTANANAADQSTSTFVTVPPVINLPKGGGAIRGIGEKFAANPVTGTGSMTVPIATSPGRSGFGPELALSYDSGAGNGPFGFGWNLSLPSIIRKTDKGLPQYNDAEESDVFILSGAEDLVPEFKKDTAGNWVLNEGEFVIFDEPRTIDGDIYAVRRYCPRIEGLFARIERWIRQSDGDVHWRSISKDNILTLYGRNAKSRIFDPDNPRRVFSWLICETRDDKGNAILYEYKSEDGVGVDLTRASERNRGDRDDPHRTSNRYLKHILYGNRMPLLDDAGHRPHFITATQIQNANWMFEVVLDYGEHDADIPKPNDPGRWDFRNDPFSTYRPGFEVRTTRLCQRVLMFHHFPNEGDVGNDCLVRSTDFTYSHEQDPNNSRNPVYTFLREVTQIGYKRDGNGYLKRSLPSVVFEYTQPIVQDKVEKVDPTSLENLPVGLDDITYQWTDLHGEGIPGILTEQADAWFYMRNLSPINVKPDNIAVYTKAKFAPIELVMTKPNLPLTGGAQFMDLAGDGQPDLVMLDGPLYGLYEHDGNEGWQSFRPFTSRLNRDMRDPNLRFVDLDGDGHADVLITEDAAFVWHPSLAEGGFGPAQRVAKTLDEEKGPRLVFADGTQSIYLADLSGDGLTDLLRIRNDEICYWPNLGYSRFGAKITMDNTPHFDHPDQFDQKRIRLADIDGTGTTDIIYLRGDGVRLYFNQSGNGWSEPQILNVFPRVDDLVSIVPTDLLGNGSACLVWSSPLPGDARQPMRYVNLMGEQKPHLLIKTINNLGAETRVEYAPSTKFYLQDKHDGRPWITRLPFPVHVVERVETYDHISHNCFVTRYAYHHGYYDGEEREFRGFGMVEQWDTEEIAALTDNTLSEATNIDAVSHAPPVHTKTWFHTGVYLDREYVSRQFQDEYYREPGLNDDEFQALLLRDTILTTDLTPKEEREACRALKGMMLRQEMYADDAPPGSSEAVIQRAGTPYTVVEQNFTLRMLQPLSNNRHAVFFSHSRETITYHYERNPADPRIQHALTLEVDNLGNVLREIAIGYGRRQPDATLPLQADRDKQTRTLITYTENRVTNAIDNAIIYPHDYRTPVPCETQTYELTGFKPENNAARFSFDEWARNDFALLAVGTEIPYERVPDNVSKQKRLIEHVRTLYRKDDLTTLLPLGVLEPLALPGESYKLAFTPGLLAQVFRRNGQPLLPNPSNVLGGQGADRGGYVVSQGLKASGNFPNTDPDDHWWIPSGRVYLSPSPIQTPTQELTYARQHFFLPHRYRDPFHTNTTSTESFVIYDVYDLLILETRDPLGNRITVGERLLNEDIDPTSPGNDYRVLQPQQVMDPNRNRTRVAFDALGMVVGTAVMGKPEDNPIPGDRLETTFRADLTQAETDQFFANPTGPIALTLLDQATTRIIYDLEQFRRTRETNPGDATQWLPPYAATLARETHVSDLDAGQQTKIQISFSYSDGFGREIQKKIQAEAGPAPRRDATGEIIVGTDGQLEMTPNNVSPRWVSSGWTVFNNKGKPVRQYEPFFTDFHRFEFDMRIGVSPVLFYDPIERVVATLHPNRTWEKAVFDPWQQKTWDVNDTVLVADPKTDPDVGSFFSQLPNGDFLPTWYEQRQGGALGTQEQIAAYKTAVHADTPTITYTDALGRAFLTVAHNKFKYGNTPPAALPTEEFHRTRVILDTEGNQREVRDERINSLGNLEERIVMRYDYNLLGNRIHQASMEAGERWMLNDVAGKSLYIWDSRNHQIRAAYDPLRRPTSTFLQDGAGVELLVSRTVYGETQPNPEVNNLRGKVVQVFDQAGVVSSDDYDFKSNLRRNQRQLAQVYKSTLNWFTSVPLETEIFTSLTTYDALNRPIQLIVPHSNRPNTNINVIQPSYNEANLLEQVEVWLNQNIEPTGLLNPLTANLHAVTDIDYDAKGQRTLIDYGNGVRTTYKYDPLTFRLIHLLTRRDPIAFPGDCPQPSLAGWPGCQLQNLHYTYDPVGNITHIHDNAQQTIYFRNKRVEPSAEYTYDAVYRLIEATDREHLGQVGGSPIPHSYDDGQRTGLLHPNDGNTLGTYTERYVYDAVGNILEMQHRGSDPAHPGWTRRYAYAETSLIEDGASSSLQKTSNRLSSTSVGNNNPLVEQYEYDPHGNMIRMPHLDSTHPNPNMHWDFQDQLSQADLGSGGASYYTYDTAGKRVRKVWEKSSYLIEERIYLGGFEIFRQRNGTSAMWLERETLHIMDDKQRVALIETRTFDMAGNDPAPQQLIRYQFGNHLDSASLELDDQALIISYEEYTPYGSTSYQAVRNQTETPKRYRYSGKERDEESGFYYYGRRYSPPWLGRWTAADPAGLVDGPNMYTAFRGNPIRMMDRDGQQSLETPWANRGPGFNGLVGVAQQYSTFDDFIRDLPIPMDPNNPELRRAWNRAHPSVTRTTHRGIQIVQIRGGAADALSRSSSQTFTEAALTTDSASTTDITINANLYGGGNCFTGACDPTSHPAIGQVIERGAQIGGNSSPDRFFAAYDEGTGNSNLESTWTFGQGNPPSGADAAFGGAAPLIINGLPYDTSNAYSPSAPAGLPTVGDPGAANRQYLTQRSNATFTSLQNEGVGVGIPVVAYDRDEDVLIILVQDEGNSGGLDLRGIRDLLIRRGADDAVAFDGSTSASLVVDQTIVVSPSFYKNNTIPFGLTIRVTP